MYPRKPDKYLMTVSFCRRETMHENEGFPEVKFLNLGQIVCSSGHFPLS